MSADRDHPTDSSLESDAVRELRRGYHDRIAELRALSVAVVAQARTAAELATEALLQQDRTQVSVISAQSVETAAVVAEVDAEVLALLALQAPVARDLRIILAARDVAQVGDLCMGLSRSLAGRVGCAAAILSGGLMDLAAQVGSDATDVLRMAEAAWATLDEDLARQVIGRSDEARLVQVEFFATLLGLDRVPVEAAVDLGMAARVFERLVDHAGEIAGRVVFAVSGAAGVW